MGVIQYPWMMGDLQEQQEAEDPFLQPAWNTIKKKLKKHFTTKRKNLATNKWCHLSHEVKKSQQPCHFTSMANSICCQKRCHIIISSGSKMSRQRCHVIINHEVKMSRQWCHVIISSRSKDVATKVSRHHQLGK